MESKEAAFCTSARSRKHIFADAASRQRKRIACNATIVESPEYAQRDARKRCVRESTYGAAYLHRVIWNALTCNALIGLNGSVPILRAIVFPGRRTRRGRWRRALGQSPLIALSHCPNAPGVLGRWDSAQSNRKLLIINGLVAINSVG